MSRSTKIVGISLVAGLIGVLLSVLPLALDLQERWGLKLLFRLRGVREPPSKVVIVSMDRETINALGLSNKVRHWPRRLHAQLVEALINQGAAAIVFDLLFDEAQDADVDAAFAAAVENGEHVILCEAIQQEKIPITDASGQYLADLNIETILPPISSLSNAALALAPFPLPKVPVQLSQFWMFKAGAGNVPTLPVVAYFISASLYYEAFYDLFVRARPNLSATIPHVWRTIVRQRKIEETLTAFRELFIQHPFLARDMRNLLKTDARRNRDASQRQQLEALIRLFQSNDSRYLNFYGPAGTLRSISYHQILTGLHRDSQAIPTKPRKGLELEGNTVFVGVSETLRPQQQDGYHTVFSKSNGIRLSGVEIAATAYANLLEDRLVTPLTWPVHRLLVFAFGCLLGLICYVCSVGLATASVTGLGALYLATAVFAFSTKALWLPVAIPLFVLIPLALIGTVACRYCLASKERKAIRKAFGYFLPNPVVDQLAKNLGNLDAGNQVVYGICLFTDAQQYAALSETMHPDALRDLMNRYYARLFAPVKKHGGIVSDVVGDSMMAIWAKNQPDRSLREAACHAALGIVEAIRAFNHDHPDIQLKTRVGVHAGHILVGNIGAIDHYEYRPVGDIVNTASRMEGMNKYLGTQILVSDQVVQRLEGFTNRLLGEFLPLGKTKPVIIHELLGYAEQSSEQQQALLRFFQTGLNAFKGQHWDEAIDAFEQALTIYRADGPSIYYRKLCDAYRRTPPGERWNGIVVMDRK